MINDPLYSSDTSNGNGQIPRSLVSVLGTQIVQDAIASFVDYTNTAVVAYERDGTRIGDLMAKNEYCRLILEYLRGDPQGMKGQEHVNRIRNVIRSAIDEGEQQEDIAAGITFCASPILVDGLVNGAILAVVSDPPADENIIKGIAADLEMDAERLQSSIGENGKMPEEFAQAARRHLEVLAGMLGKLYQDSIEKEQVIAQVNARDRELEATRELDERILSSMTAGVAVFDRDLKIRVWNTAAQEITGVCKEDAIGGVLLNVLPEAAEIGFDREFLEVIESGDCWSKKDLHYNRDGWPARILDVTVAPLRDSGGKISGVVVIFEDVTADVELHEQLDHRVKELEALYNVAVTSSGTLELPVLLERSAKVLNEATSAGLVAIYVIDHKKQTLTMAASSIEPDNDVRKNIESYGLDEGPVGRAAATGKVEVIFNISEDENVTSGGRETAARHGLNSLLAMPIKAGHEVMGVLTVLSSTPEICSEAQIRFIELLSDQLGIAIQNSGLYSEVDGTNRFLNSLLDGMAEGVFTYEMSGRIKYVNKAAELKLGYSTAELLEMNVMDLVPKEQQERIKKMMARRKAGETDSYKVELVRKDGARIKVNQTVTPLYEENQIIGAIGVAMDVTEEQRLESDLYERNRRLALLQSIISNSISDLFTGKALRRITKEIAEGLGYDFCSMFMPTADGKKLEIVASNEGDPVQEKKLNAGDTHSLDNAGFLTTPPARSFLRGEQVVITDATKFEGYDHWRDLAGRMGFHTVISTPMEYMSARIGALQVLTCKVRDVLPEELDFLRTIAGQVANIAGAARIYEMLVESEQRYRELYDSAADWLYTLDDHGVILECNKTMVKSLGFSMDELIGRHIYDFEDGRDTDKSRAALEETRKKSVIGKSLTFERTFVTKSGLPVIVEIHAITTPGSTAESHQWRVVGRDVTEKKKTAERINLLAAAVENTHECVMISGLDSRIISINDSGARMFGFTSPEEMNGMDLYELFNGENPPPLMDEILRDTGNEGWEGRFIHRRVDGTSFPAHVSSAVVSGEDGEPIALVTISLNVSDETRMTEEIIRRNQELAVLNSVASTVSTSLDLESTLLASVNAVVDSMNYDSGAIFLLARDGKTISMMASCGIPDDIKVTIGNIKVGEGYAGRVAANGEPLFTEDSVDNPFRLPGLPEKPWFASLGGVPLKSKEKLLGVMMIGTQESHEFDINEKRLLASVGKTIGVAIDNANLFEDVARAKSDWEITFDAMTNGVSIHDLDFNIIRANRALAGMLGTTPEELIGKKCFKVFHGLDEPITACPHVKAVGTGKGVNLVAEEPYLEKTLNISADPLHDLEGNCIGTVHDVRDITEQEQLRNQLTQSEKIRALGEMAGGVAHDFNNFLTVITGHCQLLLSDCNANHDARESLESIQRAARDASETVRRIQEFTRVRTTRSFSTVDMNSLIRNTIDVSRPRWKNEADARGTRIDIETSLNEIPSVNGNDSELSEVFMNLILNAVDSMEEGGTITIESKVAGQTIEISVSDTGTGMNAETINRVFEPFYSTKGTRGSGLGMSVAYAIVKRHGGDIIVASKRGKGSTFTVRLPQAAIDVVDIEPEPEEPLADASPGNILVVDDAEMIRDLLHDMLEDMGHTVEVAENGLKATLLFERALKGGDGELPFDIVLTDLGMPGMSGWDVVEKVKELSSETPVVLITGWGDQLDEEKMLHSRVDEVLAKPFKIRDVKRLVNRALSKDQQ